MPNDLDLVATAKREATQGEDQGRLILKHERPTPPIAARVRTP